MALYRYKAAARDGTLVEGEMAADSREAVVRRLQAAGQVPILAEEVRAEHRRRRGARAWLAPRRVTRGEVALLTVQLATLLEAGLGLDRALVLLLQLAEREPLRALLARLHGAVRSGEELSSALAAEGDTFPPFYRNMVRAGEASGTLELTLARLAEFLDHGRELRDSVVSALIYPLLLVFLAGVSVVLMLTYVVPQFAVMFEDAGAALPLPTRVLMAISAALQGYGWLAIPLLAGGWLWLRRALADPVQRRRLDRRALAVPVVGALITAFEAARFTRTLGTLLANGVSMLVALGIARESVLNRHIAAGLARVVEEVRGGQGLAGPLVSAAVFPPLVGQMLQVGEESGQLERVLLRLAEVFEREVRQAVRRLVALVEPALILTLGVIIAAIILSILAAILQVNRLAF